MMPLDQLLLTDMDDSASKCLLLSIVISINKLSLVTITNA